MVAAALSRTTLKPALVDSRECIVTDGNYTRAAPHFEETNAALRRNQPCSTGRVPVMGGFIGAIEPASRPRSAAAAPISPPLSSARAERRAIEIWTDVDGMMTTDPNVCPGRRRIKIISFEEAAELAYFGAKVLHPATVLPAIQKNIPVYILNSRNPSCEGRESPPARRTARISSRPSPPKSASPSSTWPRRACCWHTAF